MKDKLMKYGHKKAYYRFRSFGKAFAFIVALAVGSALPIFVVANASSKPATAQEAEPLRRDGSDLLAPPNGIVGDAQEIISGDMKIISQFNQFIHCRPTGTTFKRTDSLMGQADRLT